ncbi:MAG: hypothetical protein VW683_16675, partial [Betaproteobacteria bacterium]
YAVKTFEMNGYTYGLVGGGTKLQIIGLQVQADSVDLTFSVSTAISESIDFADSTSTNKTWLIDQDDESAFVESLGLTDEILAARHMFLEESLTLDDNIVKKDTVRNFTQTLELKSSSPDKLVLRDSITNQDSGMSNYLNNAVDVEVVTISGTRYAVVAHDGSGTSNDGVAIFNISDPENVSFVSNIQVSSANDLDIDKNNVAYVVGGSTKKIDLSDPENPSIISAGGSTGGKIVVITDDVYGGEYFTVDHDSGTYGTFRVAISNLFQIDSLSCSSSSACTNPVAAEFLKIGSKVYVVYFDGTSGLQIVDMTNPYDISVISTLSIGSSSSGKGMKLFTVGSTHYAALTTDDKVYTVKIDDPYNPEILDYATDNSDGFLQLDYAKALGVFDDDRFHYVVVGGSTANDNGMQILDVTDPTDIKARGVLGTINSGYISDIETFSILESTYPYNPSKNYAVVLTDNTVSGKSGIHLVELNDQSINVTWRSDAFRASVSETLTLSDRKVFNAEVMLEESVTLDAEIILIESAKILSESLSFTDTITRHTYKNLSESLSLSDNTIRNVIIQIDESISFTLDIGTVKLGVASPSETLGFSDSIKKDVTINLEEEIVFDPDYDEIDSDGDATNGVTRLSVTGYPQDLVYDSANGLMYLAGSPNSFSYYDTGTYSKSSAISFGTTGGTLNAAFDSANGRIYYAMEADDVVKVIRTSDNTVISTISVGDM